MGRWETKSLSGEPLFAASNSGKGFFSFYEDVFGRRELERRYLIKGGPGTGKNRLLQRVAEHVSEGGHTVEYYRCASDPDSLDGLVIDGRIAVIDATAPHALDAELPGARDEIVNLGVFWDSEALAARKEEIRALTEKKRACYARGYRLLAACDGLYADDRALTHSVVKHEKLAHAVERHLSKIPHGDGFSLLPGLSDAVGMKGSVHLDSYEVKAEHLFVIDDIAHTGTLFLRALLTGGMQKECAMRVSYHPIHVGEPDAVYFCHTGDCFVIGKGELPAGKEITHINMKRFVDVDGLRGIRSKLRMNGRMYDALLDAAEDTLREAGRHHFALESIYMSCMDFDAQNRFVRSFCERIL